ESEEGRRQIGRAVEHAVALKRSRNRQPDTMDLVPVQTILLQKLGNRLDPAANDGEGAVARIRRALQELRRNGLPIVVDPTSFRRGRPAIGADIDGPACAHPFTCFPLVYARIRLGIPVYQGTWACQSVDKSRLKPIVAGCVPC